MAIARVRSGFSVGTVSKPVELLLVLVFLALAFYQFVAAWSAPFGLGDFGSFYAAGEAARTHRDPYAVYPLTFQTTLDGRPIVAPNLDPPALLPLFSAFTLVRPPAAFRAWNLLSLLVYLGGVAALVRSYPRRQSLALATFLLAFAPLWDDLVVGQIYVLLLIGVVAAWQLLRAERGVLAGIAIGLVATAKPNFLLWPLALLVAGAAAPALVALATAAIASALPVVLYGPIVYREWVAGVMSSHGLGLATNGSVFGIGPLVRRPDLADPIGLPLALLLIGGLAIWARRSGADPLTVSGKVLVIALLASPIAWMGYGLVLLPLFVARRWSRMTLTAAAALLITSSLLPTLLALAVDRAPIHGACPGDASTSSDERGVAWG